MDGIMAFTASQARAISEGTYTADELRKAVDREHERIRKAASEGRNDCSMFLWDFSKALAAEVKRTLEREGYRIVMERHVMGGYLQDPYPYIHW